MLNGNTPINGRAAPYVVPPPAEAHTDMCDTAEVYFAYESLLPVTEGDKVAAAILATGAVIADAVNRLKAVQ